MAKTFVNYVMSNSPSSLHEEMSRAQVCGHKEKDWFFLESCLKLMLCFEAFFLKIIDQVLALYLHCTWILCVIIIHIDF